MYVTYRCNAVIHALFTFIFLEINRLVTFYIRSVLAVRPGVQLVVIMILLGVGAVNVASYDS